jgi:hypothetical protein
VARQEFTGTRDSRTPTARRGRLAELDQLPPIPADVFSAEFYRWRALLAKGLRRSVPNLATRDRAFLNELQRTLSRPDDVRYRMVGVIRLAGLCSRSTLKHHREALAQLLRALVIAQRDHSGGELLTVAKAFGGESRAQGRFDDAQMQYALEPTRANHRSAVMAGQEQLVWTQSVLDALHASPPTQ